MLNPICFSAASAKEARWIINEFGFIRFAHAFSSEEVRRLGDAADALIANPPNAENITWRSPGVEGGSIVQRISRANLFSKTITAKFLNAPQLLLVGSWILDAPEHRVRIATGAEGSDGIVLVIKDPRNQSVHRDLRWHRDDKFTGHLSINPFLNCGLYLDAADASRGGLLVLPGSHKVSSYDGFEETIRELPGQVCVCAQPGDLVVHRADLWHRSGAHKVPGELRRVLYANIYGE